MKKDWLFLPVAALIAANLITLPAAASVVPPTSLDALHATQPETVDSVLATLESLPADLAPRAQAIATLAERLAQAAGDDYRKTGAEEGKELRERVLARLTSWNSSESEAIGDDFLMQLARAMRESGRPAEARELFILKLDRMKGRPIGTSLDDFFATVEEAIWLDRRDQTAMKLLVAKAARYIEPVEYDTESRKQRLASIVVAPGQNPALSQMEAAADALQKLGASLLGEGYYSLAVSVFMQEGTIRSTYRIDAPDSTIRGAANNRKFLAEAWKNMDSSPSAGSLAEINAQERVELCRTLLARHPSDIDIRMEYGWALRQWLRLQKSDRVEKKAKADDELRRIVTGLLEQKDSPLDAYRLAIAYYDDRGNDAARAEQELDERRRALDIAQTAQQLFGEASMVEPVTVIAMNMADTFKRAGRDDDALRYYRIARRASDADIAAAPGDLVVVNRRFKLLSRTADLAEKRGDLDLTLDAATAQLQLTLAMQSRGFNVDRILSRDQQRVDVLRTKLDNIIRARAEERLRLSPAPALKPALPLPPALVPAGKGS